MTHLDLKSGLCPVQSSRIIFFHISLAQGRSSRVHESASSKWPLGELSNPSCFVSTANRRWQKVDTSGHLHLFWGKGLPQEVQTGRRIRDAVTEEEGPGSAGQQHAEACVPAPAVEETENRIPQQSRVQLNNLLSSLTQQQSRASHT